MGKYGIVAVGYNRVNGLKRLLTSLEAANYDNDDVTLIVSLDNSGNDECVKMANAFEWTHGEKRVRTFPERQGLRKHILQCGQLVHYFDAIAVLEDDLIVSPSFYLYMKATVNKYQDDDNIAGISLYSHLWNVHANKPFDPSFSGEDVYFMQFAQSWGQIWMQKQWSDFEKWYEQQDGFGKTDGIPKGVTIWPETSWLKYHIKYCIENNKYFVYPYMAYSTCFSDVGEHMKVKDTHLQVPMVNRIKKQYLLPAFKSDNAVYYDAFFERVFFDPMMIGDIPVGSICIDLYGMKESYDRPYVLSVKNLPYKIEKTFGIEVKPLEENIVYNIEGNDIKLYNTKIEANNNSNSELNVFKYRFRLYGNTPYLVKCIFDKVKRKIKAWF